MGFYEETGILILGTRLKRLSERFLTEVSRIYEKLEITFEPAWFPIVFLIYKNGPLSITEISKELNVSQPAGSQLVSVLCKKGFLLLTPDKEDRRKKIVNFSLEGHNLVKQLIPVWETLEKSMFEIFDDVENNSHLIENFNEVERKLNEISLCDSVLDKLNKV